MNINKIITLMATVLIFLIQGSYGMETINLKSFIKGSGKNISNDLRNIMNEFEKNLLTRKRMVPISLLKISHHFHLK